MVYICLFIVNIPDGDLEKNETCRRPNGFYVTAYILILMHLLLLSMKLFISAMKLILLRFLRHVTLTYQITGLHFPEDCTLYYWNRNFKVPPWNLATQRNAQRLPKNFITRTQFSVCMCMCVCVCVCVCVWASARLPASRSDHIHL